MPDEITSGGTTSSTSVTSTPPTTVHVNGANGVDVSGAAPQPPETLRALQSEREARAAAERDARNLKAMHESDKTAWATEKDNLTKTLADAQAKAVTSEVKRMLGAAGCVDVDVAAMAGEFRGVAEDKIADAVKEFRDAHPSMFPKAAPTSPHSFDGGAQPGQPQTGRTMNDVIRRAAGKGP